MASLRVELLVQIMDSITQFALGSSVALAMTGRHSRTRSDAWKVAIIGGVVGTLPDLDAFIDFGDAISNMIRHRAETHGLFTLTLVAPLLGFLIAKFQGEPGRWRRWTLATWLILITHVGIDYLTIYGTQLLQPFSDRPYGLGSMFVIDPLYTIPLICGVISTVIICSPRRWQWNQIGLTLSSAYIAWGLGVHQHAVTVARQHLPVTVDSSSILVTAAPLNTLLWRALVVTPEAYYEGWYSLLDPERKFTWETITRDQTVTVHHANHPDVLRVASFSHGFFSVDEQDQRLYVTDLRLGLEPFYSFRFDVGPLEGDPSVKSSRVGIRPDLATGVPWLWQRMKGDTESYVSYRARVTR